MADKITIQQSSLGNCDIEPGSRDAVFGHAALLGLKEKDSIFNDIWVLLKSGGQVLLAEFIAKSANGAQKDREMGQIREDEALVRNLGPD